MGMQDQMWNGGDPMGLEGHVNAYTSPEFPSTGRIHGLAAVEIEYGVTKFIGLDVGDSNLRLTPAACINPILGSSSSPTHTQ